jgi:hypothetical protein
MKRAEIIKVVVVNHSTTITDQDAAAGVAAMQKQVSEDFAPVWNIDARLEFAGKDRLRASLPDHWGLVLVDDQSQSDELGYHEVTTAGLPLATICVSRIPKGQDWTHAASHELLEMLADPHADLAIYSRPDEATQRIYAHEICDPCASYDDGYEVAGRRVTDFVFPSWFHSTGAPGANGRYDERGLIKAPLEVRPGGYIGVLDPSAFTWTIVGADAAPAGASDPRMDLRTTPKSGRQLSDMDWIP